MKKATPSALAMLQAHLQRLGPLPEADWQLTAPLWQQVQVSRKTVLTAAGDTERYLYFVVEGIQRIYYTKNDGRESTLIFTYAPSFSGVFDSMLLQQPSRFSLETLTRSVLLRTHYLQWQQLLRQSPAVDQLAQLAIVRSMSGLMERMAELQCFTAEEKFRTLLQRSPHVMQLIPHKYLANYLGLDASTFSKLLGTIRL